MRPLALLALLVATAAPLAAQPAADRALVARLYAALAAGDESALAGALDAHVVWTEVGPPVRRYVGPATVAAHVRAPGAGRAAVPDTITADAGLVVATGTVALDGRVVPFRDVWRLLDGRVVGVERTLGAPAGNSTDGPR